MNRTKNIEILIILILTLLFVKLIPVTCLLHQVTGISCPTCGMTRAFESILCFDLYSAFSYNMLSIPLFLFIINTVFVLIYEIITNKFCYGPYLVKIFTHKPVIFCSIFLVLFSFIINNIKVL